MEKCNPATIEIGQHPRAWLVFLFVTAQTHEVAPRLVHKKHKPQAT